jgi:hypothetical protein
MTSRCKQLLGRRRLANPVANFQPTRRLAWIGLVLLLVVASSARAEGPEDKFLRIYNNIEKADALAKKGQKEEAKAKYEQAQTELRNLKSINPTWNAKAVAYRLSYVGDQLTGLSQPPTASATEVAGPSKSGALPAGAQVKLLSPGAEPRQVLRLHPKPGDQQTLTVTIKQAVEMQMGEVPGQPMKMPAMTMALDVTIKDVAANGDISFETSLGDTSVTDEPGVLPQVAEAMKTALGGAKGTTSTGTMSNRGLTKGSETKLPSGAAPQMRQSLDQLKDSLANATVPLPEEAIGPGAKWEVKLPLKSQGMTIDQTATYELVSVEGDRLNVKSAIVQQAANQKIQNPAMPALKVDLIKMSGNGGGDCKLDLARLLPESATVAAHTEMAMGMNMGGQKQAMKMKSEMNIRLESK